MKIKTAVIAAALIMCPFLMTAYAHNNANPAQLDNATGFADYKEVNRIFKSEIKGADAGIDGTTFLKDRSIMKIPVIVDAPLNPDTFIKLSRAMAETYHYYFEKYGRHIFTISIAIEVESDKNQKKLFGELTVVYQTFMTPKLYNLAAASSLSYTASLPLAWKTVTLNPKFWQ